MFLLAVNILAGLPNRFHSKPEQCMYTPSGSKCPTMLWLGPGYDDAVVGLGPDESLGGRGSAYVFPPYIAAASCRTEPSYDIGRRAKRLNCLIS